MKNNQTSNSKKISNSKQNAGKSIRKSGKHILMKKIVSYMLVVIMATQGIFGQGSTTISLAEGADANEQTTEAGMLDDTVTVENQGTGDETTVADNQSDTAETENGQEVDSSNTATTEPTTDALANLDVAEDGQNSNQESAENAASQTSEELTPQTAQEIEPQGATTQDIIRISGNVKFDDAGYESKRPTDVSKIKFTVKLGDTEIPASDITVKNVKLNGGVISYEMDIKNYTQGTNNYTISASMADVSSYYNYTSTTAGLAGIPSASSDGNIFEVNAGEIKIAPDVTPAKNETFTIKWWDGNNAGNERPTDKNDFLNKCKLQYKVAGSDVWEDFDETVIEAKKLIVTSSIDDNWKITYKGVAAKIDGQDVSYRLLTPDYTNNHYIWSDEGSNVIKYDYCEEIKGTITWNNYAIATDPSATKPEKDDIAIKVSYVREDGTYKVIDDASEITDHKDKNTTLGVIINQTETVLDTSSTNTSGNEAWKYTISNLPSYDKNGNHITYVVTEEIKASISDEYKIEYDNKGISTAVDACYNGGEIKNTIIKDKNLTFNVEWEEPTDTTVARPEVKYTLWRYAKGKKLPNSAEDYDYSTAAMVTYVDNTGKHIISESHNFGADDTWSNTTNKYTISFPTASDSYSLPMYDEEGYEYVYFIKQTDDNMSTDLDNYDEYFIDNGGNYNPEDEKLAYEGGTIKNVYQEEIDVDLTKQWKNIKNPEDLQGATVNLVLTREDGDGNVDDDFEEVVSLTDFSSQLSSKTGTVTLKKFDKNCKEYKYIISESIVKDGNETSVTYTYDNATSTYIGTYNYNNHPYKSTYEMTDNGDGTWAYKVINEETSSTTVEIKKVWGDGYNTQDFVKLPDSITTYLQQDGVSYATIEIKRPDTVTEKGSAKITYVGGKTIENVEVIISPDGYTWTLPSGTLEVPQFDNANKEYVYTITEARVTKVPENKHWGYTTSYNRETKADGSIVLTEQITNYCYKDGEYNYKDCWAYKNWEDDSDATNRSPLDIHVVIKAADGTVQYDLSTADGKNAFITDVKTGYGTDKTTEELTKVENIINGGTYSLKLSKGNDWKTKIIIPKELEEYAVKAAGNGATYSMIEANMYSLTSDTLFPATTSDGVTYVNNEKQKYKVTVTQTGDTFTFTNTRVGQIDVSAEFKWNDFKNFPEVRPDEVDVELWRYTDDGTPVKVSTDATSVDVTLTGAVDGTYKCTFDNQDEYDGNGKVYHYVLKLSYKKKDDSDTLQDYDIKHYVVDSSVKYTQGSYSDESATNSKLEYKYEYDLSDDVTTRDVSFYKIWRDKEIDNNNQRPDLALRLYKIVSYADASDIVNANASTTPTYCGAVNMKSDVLTDNAYRYTFCSMPEYSVIRNEAGEVVKVEKYTYSATEVINTTSIKYYQYIYDPEESVMKDNAFTSYADVNDWGTYADLAFADGEGTSYTDIKSDSKYAKENGCFVNGIEENLTYKGSKSWVNMPAGIDKGDYPYVEVYFFQTVASDTNPINIDALIAAGNVSDLRDKAYTYTKLSDGKDSFYDNVIVPKYNEKGEAYKYTIVECIFKGGVSNADGSNFPAAGDLTYLPGFIMAKKSSGLGTNVFLTNEFDTVNNVRPLTIKKSWVNESAAETANTVAKFNIYRIEKVTEADDITTVAQLDEKIDDESAQLQQTVYLTNDGGTATKDITNVPLYSPRGFEYIYVAVEDTGYAPSYNCVAPDSEAAVKPYTVLNGADGADYRYIKFASVAQYDANNNPVNPDNKTVQAAIYKNEKNTEKAVLEGAVKWVDYNNDFDTRPEEKMVYLTVKRATSQQSDGQNNAGNADAKTAIFTGTDAEWVSGTAIDTTMVFKVPAAKNSLNQDIYITWTKDDDNNKWTYSITGVDGAAIFDIYSENGTQWKYYVTEDKTEGSTYQYFADNYTGYGSEKGSTASVGADVTDKKYTFSDITNTLSSKVTIQKQWKDSIDQYKFRPVSIKIKFQYRLAKDTSSNWIDYEVNTSDTFVIDKSTNWKKVFGQLPKKDNAGNDYEFRVVETSISVNVDDSGTAKEIGVKYFKPDSTTELEIVGDTTITTLSGKTENLNGGTYYLGKAGSYTAKVPTTISPNSTGSIFIYNNLEDDDVISLKISKTWSGDSTYKTTVRPAKIYVKIQKALVDDTVTVTADYLAGSSVTWQDVKLTDGKSPLVLDLTSGNANADNANVWEKTYDELPKYDTATGKICYYRAVESDKDGNIIDKVGSYAVTNAYSYNAAETKYPYSTNITNTYKKGSLTVSKIWNDDSNRDGKRPEKVTVDIMYHDYDKDTAGTESWEKFTTVTLGKDTTGDGYTWTKTLTDLPYYYISENIPSKNTEALRYMEYKVVEQAVTNYTATYSADNATYISTAQSFVYTADKTSATTKVKNSYTPEKGKLKLVKAWSGDDKGGRPSSIDVRLYRTYTVGDTTYYEYYDGSATTPSWNAETTKLEKTNTTSYITKLEGTAWNKSLTDLPLKTNKTATAADSSSYTAGTALVYTYYLEEITNHGGYTPGNDTSIVLENNKEKTLTLTNTMKPLNINVNFNWDDIENLYKIRDNYEVVVQRKTSSDSDWSDVTSEKAEVKYDTDATKAGSSYSFTNLPQYSSGNALYDYRVVLKHKDGDSFAGNTTTTTVVDLTGSIAATAPVQDGSYQVTSTGVTTTTATDGSKTMNFNATAHLPVITVVGDIVWEDKFKDTDNYFGVRPGANTADATVTNAYKIAIDAKADGGTASDTTINGYIAGLNKTNASCKTTDVSNTYTYEFTQLLKYNANGNLVSYSTSEVVDKSYTASSTERTTKVEGSATTANKYVVDNHTASSDGNTHTMTTIKNVLNVKTLTLKKVLMGADANEEFTFNLYFRTNVADNWTLYDTYVLKTAETVAIDNLLQNAYYKIEELGVEDYNVTAAYDPVDTANTLTVTKTVGDDNSENASTDLVLSDDKKVIVTNQGLTTTTITVTKNWEGETYTSISERPDKIYFILQRSVKNGPEGEIWKTVKTVNNGDTIRVFTMSKDTVKDNCDTSNTYTVTVDADNKQWTCNIDDIQAFSNQLNKKFIYRVIETDKDGNPVVSDGNYRVANYDVEYPFDPDDYDSHSVHNNANSIMTNEYVKKDLNVSFTWDDDNNRDGVRPDEVEYILKYYDVDGNLKTYTVKNELDVDIPYVFNAVPGEDNSWSAVIEDLPVYDVNGNEIKYVITEAVPDEYTNISTLYNDEDTGSIKLTGDEAEVKITNRYIPKTKSLTIKKYWNGDEDVADISRPDSISVLVYRTYTDVDGNAKQEYLAENGEWKENRTDAKRVELNKSMKLESTIEDSGSTEAPESADSGNAVDEHITVWSYTLDGAANNMLINAYTKNAHTSSAETVPYTYWVEEVEFDGYTVIEKDGAEKNSIKLNIAGDAIVGLVNELDTIDVKAEISWDDYNNKLDTRKDTVLVLQSYTDGKWTNVVKPGTEDVWMETADENWKAEFNTLPTHDKNGNKIYYRVVIGSFDSKADVLEINDTTGEDGISGNAQEGKMSVYSVEAATSLITNDNPYYFTKIDCAFKFQLAIENTTDNPAENRTNAGGKVTVMDSIDVSDFSADDIPNPDESDKTGYETAKVGVVWEADKHWTSNDKVLINYVDEDGNTKQLEISIKDMLNGNVPEAVKEVFPGIKIYKKNNKYALILTDNVLSLPEKVDVAVSFAPVYAIVNVTENAAGGTVQNVNGVSDKYSDGLAEVDGHADYIVPQVSAKADEGYAVDLNKIYIAWLDNYGNVSDSKYLVKLDSNGEFTTEIEVMIDGKLQKVTIHGKAVMVKDELGNVTAIDISSDSPVPIVFGVYFKLAEKPATPATVNTPDKSDKVTNDTTAKTGDETPIVWLFIIMLMSGSSVLYLAKRKKH